MEGCQCQITLAKVAHGLVLLEAIGSQYELLLLIQILFNRMFCFNFVSLQKRCSLPELRGAEARWLFISEK